MTGTVYTVPPIPPDPKHTTWVPAGALTFGVEWRQLDDAELAANYQGEAMEEIQAALAGNTALDRGLSIHVSGTQDGHEYLRFDLFEEDPHYHYIEPSGVRQTIVQYDRVALGEMLPWALDQLRHRLPQMLERAGGAALASKLDGQSLEAGLVQVERLARAAQAALLQQPPAPPALLRFSTIDWDGPRPTAGAPRPPEALVRAAEQSGARRKRMARGEGGFFMNHSEMPPGFRVPPHTHDHDELIVVIAGGCRFDDGLAELGPNDAIVLRAYTRYGFTCGADGMKFLTVRTGEASVALG
jgi:quercetin dioxygenase-like cupin family protein